MYKTGCIPTRPATRSAELADVIAEIISLADAVRIRPVDWTRSTSRGAHHEGAGIRRIHRLANIRRASRLQSLRKQKQGWAEILQKVFRNAVTEITALQSHKTWTSGKRIRVVWNQPSGDIARVAQIRFALENCRKSISLELDGERNRDVIAGIT